MHPVNSILLFFPLFPSPSFESKNYRRPSNTSRGDRSDLANAVKLLDRESGESEQTFSHYDN